MDEKGKGRGASLELKKAQGKPIPYNTEAVSKMQELMETVEKK